MAMVFNTSQLIRFFFFKSTVKTENASTELHMTQEEVIAQVRFILALLFYVLLNGSRR